MAVVQAQNPLERPERLKKTRRPLVHAASRVERESYLIVRSVFVETYHEGSAELLRGRRDVVSPAEALHRDSPSLGPPYLPSVLGRLYRKLPPDEIRLADG